MVTVNVAEHQRRAGLTEFIHLKGVGIGRM